MMNHNFPISGTITILKPYFVNHSVNITLIMRIFVVFNIQWKMKICNLFFLILQGEYDDLRETSKFINFILFCFSTNNNIKIQVFYMV